LIHKEKVYQNCDNKEKCPAFFHQLFQLKSAKIASGNRVIPAGMERVAPQDPLENQPQSGNEGLSLQDFKGVIGA